jgi:hypothetical protein
MLGRARGGVRWIAGRARGGVRFLVALRAAEAFWWERGDRALTLPARI